MTDQQQSTEQRQWLQLSDDEVIEVIKDWTKLHGAEPDSRIPHFDDPDPRFRNLTHRRYTLMKQMESGTLSEDDAALVKRIAQVAPYFLDDKKERHGEYGKESVDVIDEFIKKHGYVPKQRTTNREATDEEQYIALRILKIRRRFGNGELKPETIENIKERGLSDLLLKPNKAIAATEDRLNDFREFYEQNGKRPSKISDDPDERRLASWVANMIRSWNVGKNARPSTVAAREEVARILGIQRPRG